MIKRVLPIYQTGWFYLLLILWLCGYWMMAEGGFNRLNQLNLYVVNQFTSLQSSKPVIARIESSLKEKNTKQIETLLLNYPNTPVVLVGLPTDSFIQRLTFFLDRHPRDAKVIFVTDSLSYGADIATVDQSMFSGMLNWFRGQSSRNLINKSTEHFIYSAFYINKNNKVSVVKQVKNKTHLSLMGEIIRQVEFNQQSLKKNIVLHQGWQLALVAKEHQWPLGYSGNVIMAGDEPKALSLLSFNRKATKQELQLLIVEDETNLFSENIALSADRLLSKTYLYQTVFSSFVQWLLLIFGLYFIWFIRAMIPKRQALVFSGYIVILFAVQSYFLTSNVWFEVMPIATVVGFSWLILLAYREENQLFVNSNLRYNHLLIDTLVDLSHHQSSDKIQLLLAQATADKNLVKKVAEVAAQAKRDNNTKLSQVLFTWHKNITTQKESSFERVSNKEASETFILSKEKAQAFLNKPASEIINQARVLTPSLDNSHQIVDDPQYNVHSEHEPLADTEDDLEQTMVIMPGQEPPKLSSTLTLKVEKFGRYKVEGMLGKGAMGIVYQGVDPKINRHVAIKTLQITDSIDIEDVDEAKQRFFKEAETAGRLSHANIVTIYDVGEEEMLGYIAMDLLTGAPLSHFIKPMNLLPTPLVYQLMIQITDALDYAHRQNVVHRDIKPGNIIYDDDLQRATVTDFGIAYVADSSKTRTGVIMGSPYYMSPEQILGKQVDGRSDIFSLGATLYQLLCGHLPFEGDSVMSVVYQISNEKHISVTKCNDKLPPSAARITNKALQKDVDKRYQSMQEFKLALISALKRDFKKAPII